MHWMTWTNHRWHKHNFCLPGYRTRKDTFQPAQLKLAQLKNWPRLCCNIFAEAVWAGACSTLSLSCVTCWCWGDLASWNWYCQKKQMFTVFCFSDIASTTHWFPEAQLCAKVSSLLCQPFSTRASWPAFWRQHWKGGTRISSSLSYAELKIFWNTFRFQSIFLCCINSTHWP